MNSSLVEFRISRMCEEFSRCRETISISHPYEDSLADMESRLTENWTPFSKRLRPVGNLRMTLLAPRVSYS